VEKVRERLAVNKQRSQKFHMERFNLQKLIEAVAKEQHHVEVQNRFAALGDLDTEVEINSAWETIRENIEISAKESLGPGLLEIPSLATISIVPEDEQIKTETCSSSKI
jgi:hypothetical protein